MALWTADADHFTVDDNKWHTADGRHTDPGPGAGDGTRMNIIRRDDELILASIKKFTQQIG